MFYLTIFVEFLRSVLFNNLIHGGNDFTEIFFAEKSS